MLCPGVRTRIGMRSTKVGRLAGPLELLREDPQGLHEGDVSACLAVVLEDYHASDREVCDPNRAQLTRFCECHVGMSEFGHSRQSCHPGVTGSPKSGHTANPRGYEAHAPTLTPGTSFFPQQRLQRAAQQSAESGGDSLPVAGLAVVEPAEALHQIKGRAVDFDRIDRRPAIEPLTPTRGISGAPLPKGGSFLNHRPSRSAL